MCVTFIGEHLLSTAFYPFSIRVLPIMIVDNVHTTLADVNHVITLHVSRTCVESHMAMITEYRKYSVL